MSRFYGWLAAGVAVLSVTSATAAAACADPYNTSDKGLGTYNDFSQIFERSAGQFWSSGESWRNQWAWEPQTLNADGSPSQAPGAESWIRWGDPDQWPPSTYEKFERSDDGEWVLLDGFGDSVLNGMNPQRVHRETISAVDCVSNKRELPTVEGGKQHYAKWFAQPEPYCLEAWGTITHAGGVVNFYHKQVWFQPSGPWCDNPYFQDRVCMKQFEVWADDNPANAHLSKGTVEGLNLIHQRDNVLAKGLGMSFVHTNYLASPVWEANGRYFWRY